MPVLAGTYRVLYVIQDEKKQTAKMLLYLPRYTYENFLDSYLVEPSNDPEYFAFVMAELIDKLITGRIVAVHVSTTITVKSFPVTVSTWDIKPAALPTSDVEEGATMKYLVSGGHEFDHRIPSFDELLILPGSTEVDRTDPDVINFLEMMTIPEDAEIGADWSIGPTDARAGNIVDVIEAKEQFTKSRKKK